MITGMDISQEGNTVVASFLSDCVSDVEQIRRTAAEIREFVRNQKPRCLVFDFSRVKMFSSQVLSLLLEVRANLVQEQGQVVICALNAQLQRVFQVTHLDKIFRFHPNREAALAAPGEAS
jgi:anti-anti-sigma factor